MAHYVSCHKEIPAKESEDLLFGNCYKLHGVPKIIVSARDPKCVGKFWQICMGKLNIQLNMSTSRRHSRSDGLMERVNQIMQILLRCYCAKYGFDWTSHLSMVEIYYNCSIKEASTHSPYEVMYGYQSYTPAGRLLPLISATAYAIVRLSLFADIRDVVNQILKLSKERIAVRSTRIAPSFQPGDLVYLSTKGLHIRLQKCKHLRDQKLDPYKVVSKVGIDSYKLVLPKGC